MKKRILAIVLSLALIIGLVPMTVALAASDTTLKVTADKTTAAPGDTINYTVSIGSIEHLMGADFEIVIPQGLVYVEGSGKLADNLVSTLGCVQAVWEDEYRLFAMYGEGDYSSANDTVIVTFSCTVAANAETGVLVPDFANVALSDMNFDEYNTQTVNDGAKVNVVIPVTGVTLDKETLALDTGDNKTATLVATVDPNKSTDKTVTWDSSDKTVATIENGVVTAIKHGTTTITVKTVDGGFTDVCVVTVTCAHAAKTPTNAKTANCQEGGWDAYYTCDACGQLFAADGTTKISAIPTTNKDGSNHTNIQPFAADTATCTHKGHDAYEKCVDCGVVTSGSDAKYFGEHNYGKLKTAVSEKHTPDTLTPAVAAHYQCSVCLKYFTEAKVETTLAALTGTTPSHSYGNWVNTDADQHWKACGCGNKIEIGDHKYDNTCDTTCNTCGHVRTITHTWSNTWSTDGINHWKECTVCHTARNEEGAHIGGTATCQAKKECSVCHLTYGNFAGCDYVENAIAKYLVSEATCVAEAVYKKSCSVCGTAHATETFKHGTVNATNHVGETEIKGAEPATCDKDGYTGDTWCKDCNTKIKDGEPIPAGHKTTEVPANPATHEAAGNIKYYTCSGCSLLFADAEAKTEIKAEDTVVAKGEHSYGEWVNTDAENHWKECACGNKIETAAHTYGDWTVTKESTTTEKGSKEKTCSVCGHKVTEELPLAEATDKDPSSPQTGDNSNLLLWFVLLMISALGIVSTVVFKKKRVR